MHDTNDYEPLFGTGWKWTLNFEFPPVFVALQPSDDTEPADLLKAQESGVYWAINDTPEPIQIELKDFCNDTIISWMKEWAEKLFKAHESEEEGLMRYFEVREDNEHPNSIAMYLKKPLNELTKGEKSEIRGILAGVTNLGEETLEKIFR